jgi:signal peptidase I
VVTFTIPGEKQALIKRVVALPGETVEVRGGQVFINGQPLDEHWLTCQGRPNYPPQVVPPLHVFVLSDNRPNSRDSRYFGPVPTDRISGRALLVCWPLDQAKVR